MRLRTTRHEKRRKIVPSALLERWLSVASLALVGRLANAGIVDVEALLEVRSTCLDVAARDARIELGMKLNTPRAAPHTRSSRRRNA